MVYHTIITTIIIIIRHGHILLMVHHTITFVLGLLYIYFWLMARSLFLMVRTSGKMMMMMYLNMMMTGIPGMIHIMSDIYLLYIYFWLMARSLFLMVRTENI